MKEEKQTKEILLQAAKQEFMEKGYAASSLRNICKKANVTTGALYFFFRDKEDLFASIVEEPLHRLYEMMKYHYAGELKEIDDIEKVFSEEHIDDKSLSVEIVEYLYDNKDAIKLMIEKSEGSSYANCEDRFVAISEIHYRKLADAISAYKNVPRISDFTIHWVSHVQISSFVQLITHDLPKEEAVIHIDKIMGFLIKGWFSLFEP